VITTKELKMDVLGFIGYGLLLLVLVFITWLMYCIATVDARQAKGLDDMYEKYKKQNETKRTMPLDELYDEVDRKIDARDIP
jgi:Na+-transporting methylmalonyl-CoA/oxaloacetate decarboxylase gamma subunit